MAAYDDVFSSMPTPLPADNDSLFDSYIDSNAYLDQSFCSNFSCCGQTIPDLHHLLDHFEEEHVLPLPLDDNRPTYSSPIYARPTGPHASYILSYPQPDPPLHPAPLPISSAHGPLRAIPNLSHVPDLIHSPASTAPPSTSSSCISSPVLGEPFCLPPALFSFQPSRARTPSQSSRRSHPADADLDNILTPSLARSGIGPQRTTKSHPRADPLARSRPLAKTPERASAPSARRRDGREKMYKCPSYLNPNGLKYHLEKGTCTNAEVRARAPLPPAVTAAALTPLSTPASPSVSTLDSVLDDDEADAFECRI
ncbi:uncharacterized protein TRAVEDRAFT_48189 [Trametes versicolor FP-101664 SS1]|uniref:uncharacterized protein n=1 Tax=Trametes versicolor (strain FP-101664) TaxID=717944 RepID=UPI0004621405|nr:uncharacterized protein TRAVEDRAFT_48189 [Trametes versicolor FP-101664 SS1]EIW57135.1 hypothetical protein TRAVEDRAFT_48189 [Trametes versicolor FP-101664 SS1]